MDLFGIDWNGPIPDEEEAAIVDVPSVNMPLSDQDYTELLTTFSPSADSEAFGMDNFFNVLHFVCQKLALTP